MSSGSGTVASSSRRWNSFPRGGQFGRSAAEDKTAPRGEAMTRARRVSRESRAAPASHRLASRPARATASGHSTTTPRPPRQDSRGASPSIRLRDRARPSGGHRTAGDRQGLPRRPGRPPRADQPPQRLPGARRRHGNEHVAHPGVGGRRRGRSRQRPGRRVRGHQQGVAHGGPRQLGRHPVAGAAGARVGDRRRTAGPTGPPWSGRCGPRPMPPTRRSCGRWRARS